jgi:hypothetical protein
MPPQTRVTAAPMVGYFMDYGKYSGDVAGLVSMQNVVEAGGLSADCLQAFPPAQSWRCFMSPHMQRYIKTPFFMMNSRFDAWQVSLTAAKFGCVLSSLSFLMVICGISRALSANFAENIRAAQIVNILDLPCIRSDATGVTHKACNSTEQNLLVAYGQDFLSDFKAVRNESRNGAFITSCLCHAGCPWMNLTLHNRSAWAHYSRWYDGITQGRAAIAIDLRGPNGDGSLERLLPYKDSSLCVPFP